MSNDSRKITAALSLAAMLLVACGPSSITEGRDPNAVDTTSNGGGGGDDGTVQRGSITVEVTVDPVDAALASIAGISNAGLTVTLVKLGSNDTRTGITDAQGKVSFGNLLQGSYSASVTRTLTAAELEKLPAADREASVFAGGVNTPLSAGAKRTVTFPLLAARRGSLVISEIFSHNGPPIAYGFGDYIEIYNNGDTTAYLDGLMLAKTTTALHQSNNVTCENSARLRTQNEILWVSQVWGFPGSGREYPVPPGEARVVAMDAINHQAASGQGTYSDLSGAQFEQVVTDSDTDNPNSVNMLRLHNIGTGALGRGYPSGSNMSFALVRNVPMSEWGTDSLQATKSPNPATALPFWIYVKGLPGSAVLDVFSWATDPVVVAQFGFAPSCTPWLGSAFDRGVAEIHQYQRAESMRRRSLGFNASGKEILQRTRNSGRDIEYGPRLRRSLDK